MKIHKTEFRLRKGDSFVVPIGNSYSIENTSSRRAATVFYSLIKKVESARAAAKPSKGKSSKAGKKSTQKRGAGAGAVSKKKKNSKA